MTSLASYSAATKRSCSSRSDSKRVSRDGVGAARLVDQHVERRQVGIPLDERGRTAEPRDGDGVERPHLVADTCVVRVDQQLAALELADAVAGEVDLADTV